MRTGLLPASLALLLAAGCAAPLTELPRVGPLDGAPRRPGADGAGQGDLVVYSATEREQRAGLPLRPHTEYRVFRADGPFVTRVANTTAAFAENPDTVTLPAGDYVVIARAAGAGMVRAPVKIVPNRRTELWLDGGGERRAAGLGGTDWVRLPDGRLAGRAAP